MAVAVSRLDRDGIMELRTCEPSPTSGPERTPEGGNLMNILKSPAQGVVGFFRSLQVGGIDVQVIPGFLSIHLANRASQSG